MNAIPANFAPNVGSGHEFNSWATNLRGAGAGPQGGTPPTVNYFAIYAIKDFFNVDRFEIDLGPNSILFGVGNLGGVTRLLHEKAAASTSDFQRAGPQRNSFGGARATVDMNQLVSILNKDDFGIRINLLADRDETWRKEDSIKRLGASIATTFKISKLTSVRFDVEAYQIIVPQFAENMNDEYLPVGRQDELGHVGRRPDGRHRQAPKAWRNGAAPRPSSCGSPPRACS